MLLALVLLIQNAQPERSSIHRPYDEFTMEVESSQPWSVPIGKMLDGTQRMLYVPGTIRLTAMSVSTSPSMSKRLILVFHWRHEYDPGQEIRVKSVKELAAGRFSGIFAQTLCSIDPPSSNITRDTKGVLIYTLKDLKFVLVGVEVFVADIKCV